MRPSKYVAQDNLEAPLLARPGAGAADRSAAGGEEEAEGLPRYHSRSRRRRRVAPRAATAHLSAESRAAVEGAAAAPLREAAVRMRVVHSDMAAFFTGFDLHAGKYVPNEELQYEYPADWADWANGVNLEAGSALGLPSAVEPIEPSGLGLFEFVGGRS